MSLIQLQDIGLTDTEILLYNLLLKLGEIPIIILVRESKKKRTTVYKSLYSLKEKGLVSMRDIHKKIHVRPESPSRLAEITDEKVKEMESVKKGLESALPAMYMSYRHSTEKPVVRTFEGIEGLKNIYEDLLVENKPIYAILQAGEVEPNIYKWLTTKFVKKRTRKKIHVKAIVASSAKSKLYKKKDIEEYRISKVVDAKAFPFKHEIDIYGDKVAIINYKKGEPLIGIVINHPQIALTMKAWFDLAFKGARGC